MHLLVPVSRLVLLVVARVATSLWRSSHRLHRRLLLLLELGVLPSHWLGEVLIILVDLPPLVVAEAAVGALTHLLLLLALEDVVNLLKRLFALTVAQDISSLEKCGSIILEFNRNGGELPSTHKFVHEILHVGKQGLENDCLLIPLYCLKNLCLQLLPGRRLTHASLLVLLLDALLGLALHVGQVVLH